MVFFDKFLAEKQAQAGALLFFGARGGKTSVGMEEFPPARLGEFYGIGNQVSQNRELPILEFQLNQSRLKVIDEFRCIGIRFDSLVHFFIFTTVASADLHFSRKIAGFKRLTINNLMNY
jgi:hypothetical protein